MASPKRAELQARIEQLIAENARLTAEVGHWKQIARKQEDRAKQNNARARQNAHFAGIFDELIRDILTATIQDSERERIFEVLTERVAEIRSLMSRADNGAKHPRNRTGLDNHLELGFPHQDTPRKSPQFPVENE